MMKKYITAAAVSMMVLGALTGCGNGKDVGRDAALEAALADAGVNEADTSRLTVTEDRDDGRKIYEIHFDVAEKGYDYEVQASDGAIVGSDVEINEGYAAAQGNSAQNSGAAQGTPSGQNAGAAQDNSQNTQQTQNNAPAQGQQTGNGTNAPAGNNGAADVAVSLEEATQIALDRVPGATEQDIRINYDYDDGCQRYEGDIIYQQTEYDFEIDANTGEVIEWSEENVRD